jgi:hypothetical protein
MQASQTAVLKAWAITRERNGRGIGTDGLHVGYNSCSVAIASVANYLKPNQWMGGRVVEGTGLENRKTRERFEGSNPSPSPSCKYN